MLPLYIKALHIIFVVTWFAGLFYTVRLFIYHVEAEQLQEQEKRILQEQYKIMEKRLWYGIAWPSAIGTVVFGFWLAQLNDAWRFTWLWVKLAFVLGLILYHIQCGKILIRLKKNDAPFSSMKLRMWNELATLFLVSIVFVAVMQNNLNGFWASIALALLAIVLLLAVRIYGKLRKNTGKPGNN